MDAQNNREIPVDIQVEFRALRMLLLEQNRAFLMHIDEDIRAIKELLRNRDAGMIFWCVTKVDIEKAVMVIVCIVTLFIVTLYIRK